MPSSSYVEIDIQNNETAILDNPDVVISSEHPPKQQPTSPKVSQTQTQEEEAVVSPTPRKNMEKIKNMKDLKAKQAVVTPKATKAKVPAANTTVAPASLTPPKRAVATPGDSPPKKKKAIKTLDSFFMMGRKKNLGTKPLAANVESKEDKKPVVQKIEKGVVVKNQVKKSDAKGESESVGKACEGGNVVEEKAFVVLPHETKADAALAVEKPFEKEDDDNTIDLDDENNTASSNNSITSESSVVVMEEVPVEEATVDNVHVDSPKKSSKPSTLSVDIKPIGHSLDIDTAPLNKETETAESKGAPSLETTNQEKVKCDPESISDVIDITEETKISSEEKPSKSNSAPLTGKKKTKKSKAAKSSTAAAASTEIESPHVPLSEENLARMKKYIALRERYVVRAKEVASRSTSDDFVEERLSTDELPSLEKGSVEVGDDREVPDQLLPRLLILAQGSNLPLSTLSKNALGTLSTFTTTTKSLTIESISSKIKLLAQRKPHLSGNPPSPTEKPTPLAKLDCFEDSNECYLWRWELSSIDLLPPNEATKVKKARALRKKLQSHHAAIFKLISSIDNATKWLEKNPTNSTLSPSVPVLAKVSDMEEKVLKFEREEEKVRLLKEAKTRKEKDKAEELAEKQKEKERLEQERLNAKKLKEEEKAAAAKEREEAKQEAKRLKEEEKLKQQREAEEKESKRKARLMSFFGSAKKKQKTTQITAKASVDKASLRSFDGNAFRSVINSKDYHAANPFGKRNEYRTKKIRVSVHVAAVSDNPFAPQAYDEEKIILVSNKYKFLGFHEDHRPPYHGTWSKSSSLVTGRRPLGKDTEYLNYDVDSEAEWEEEDEEGEDCDKSDGEEEEIPDDDDNDSFLAAEDELGLEDEDDEETKNLRKRKLQSAATISVKASVITPKIGGLCHEVSDEAMETAIEGFNLQDAIDVLTSHAARVLTPDVIISLDALPPIERDEKEPKAPTSQKMSLEAMKTMAQFVHNSTVNSKEKIITELLITHPTVSSSRAQAMRELEVTAEKRRLPKGGGVVWEVKAEHLNTLGLTEKDLKPPPPAPEEPAPKETKIIPLEKIEPVAVPAAPIVTSPETVARSPKQSKKRKPVVSAASANLFAAFMAKGAKKQKAEP